MFRLSIAMLPTIGCREGGRFRGGSRTIAREDPHGHPDL